MDLKAIYEELVKQTANQERILKLLDRLVTLTAASAIADPLDSVGPFDRTNAASYAARVFKRRHD